ncbi:hypothetical protein EVG20_g11121 [Dentipellis fragilis]|uniref:Uncharacterized protein n=1 Tax=Dentipellis fragilis TaxID=205917 RepID=A0A4Y9XN51_9AGAM|nr:hypothetical protein EVG20_g11121 [Dentipellis fragilis]
MGSFSSNGIMARCAAQRRYFLMGHGSGGTDPRHWHVHTILHRILVDMTENRYIYITHQVILVTSPSKDTLCAFIPSHPPLRPSGESQSWTPPPQSQPTDSTVDVYVYTYDRSSFSWSHRIQICADRGASAPSHARQCAGRPACCLLRGGKAASFGAGFEVTLLYGVGTGRGSGVGVLSKPTLLRRYLQLMIRMRSSLHRCLQVGFRVRILRSGFLRHEILALTTYPYSQSLVTGGPRPPNTGTHRYRDDAHCIPWPLQSPRTGHGLPVTGYQSRLTFATLAAGANITQYPPRHGSGYDFKISPLRDFATSLLLRSQKPTPASTAQPQAWA